MTFLQEQKTSPRGFAPSLPARDGGYVDFAGAKIGRTPKCSDRHGWRKCRFCRSKHLPGKFVEPGSRFSSASGHHNPPLQACFLADSSSSSKRGMTRAFLALGASPRPCGRPNLLLANLSNQARDSHPHMGTIKKPLQACACRGFFMVPRRGIEPRTRGFSIPCSTN